MKKVGQFIRAHYKFLSVAFIVSLTIGALVGTALVAQASIPASDGTVHGCRNTTTTMLRVIDNATGTCDSNESVLNWDQKGVKAYAYIDYSGGTHSLDTDRSYNVTGFQYSNPLFGRRQFCLTVSGTPKNISVNTSSTSGGEKFEGVSIKDATGWTTTEGAACDLASPGSNVYLKLSPYGTAFFVTIH